MAAGRCHPYRRSRHSLYRVDRDGEGVSERVKFRQPSGFHTSIERLRDDKNYRKQKDWDTDEIEDNDYCRFGNREREMAAAKDGRDREKERNRYIISRRENDGGRSSSQSDSAKSNGNRHDSNAEREPGELSSGSGYDHGLNSHAVESEVQKPDPLNSPLKKRKHSPVLWDLRGQPCKVLLTETDSDTREVSNVHVEGHSDSLPHSPMFVDGLETAAELPLTSNSDGEEEALLPRNIAASRWADKVDFEEEEKTRKSPSSVDSKSERFSSERSGAKIISPEPGEYIRETLDCSQASSSSLDIDLGQDGVGSCRKEFGHNNIRGVEHSDGEFNQTERCELDKAENFKDDSHERQPESRPCEDSHPGTPMRLVPLPLPSHRTIDMLQGCRSVDEFERLNKINEGTYGIVYRARNKESREIVALKKVKMENEREGFPMTSLREINTLLSLHHPSVVDVKEVVVGSNLDSIFMVMEYMEHDLKGFMESMKQPFSQSEVKCLMLQLLEGVNYLHDNWVLHRDLKTSNLLLSNRGELKICDFGLARQYGSPLKTYTHTVVTLWYRAPELLLGSKHYSTAVDMWSLGCIMAEILSKEPLFNGKSEIDQLDKIFRMLGTPNEKVWPDFVNLPEAKCNFVKQPYNKLRDKYPATPFSGKPTLSESGFDLLNRLLTYDPDKRITSEEALKHEWFREVPLPILKDLMPTCPAQNDHDRRSRRRLKSPHPLEEHRIRELQQGDLGVGSLFA